VLRCHCSEGLEDWDMLALGAIEVGCQDLQCILGTRHCEIVIRIYGECRCSCSLQLRKIRKLSFGASDRFACAMALSSTLPKFGELYSGVSRILPINSIHRLDPGTRLPGSQAWNLPTISELLA
jgi:hypothetical protein